MSDEDQLIEPGGKVRLYVEAPLGSGVRIEPPQAHYLLHVMRAKLGDRVLLFNGRDGEWRARIDQITRRTCVLLCEQQMERQANTPDIWLVYAPIKKTPGDYVAQKATELGVRALQPVFTHRTIARRVNLERMAANAIEAAEQSGRLTVPEIREPRDLDKLITAWPRERNLLFCDEAGDAPPIHAALMQAPDGPWAVLTGPEGGFDESERAMIRALPSVVPATLGARILRADTAALAALAIWQAIKGDWGLPVRDGTPT
jgi:16S rRNA (uracil1498-N3)-methyltransferase